jgi:hypothetical protein
MAIRALRGKALLIAVSAGVSLGMLASAQAAVAAPFVQYAHFTRTSEPFYSQFGDVIDISVGNSPLRTTVCVSSYCKTFHGGEIHVGGSAFDQFWAHGQSRQVRIFACGDSVCMGSEWVSRLDVP